MNCEHVQANLSQYFDGEMSPEESEACAEHICTCEDCRLELNSFNALSAALARSVPVDNAIEVVSVSPAPAWERIASALANPSQVNASDSSSHQTVGAHTVFIAKRSRLMRVAVGLALAASLLLLVVSQFDYGQPATQIAVDFSSVIDRSDALPSQTLQQLSQQYSGKTVDAQQARQMLGYEPVALSGLGRDVRLVSTTVLKLPVCLCVAGQCKCQPGGCNCAAMLCKRADGSELLVLEHCDSDKVELTKMSKQLVDAGDRPIELFGSDSRWTASRVTRDHRVTAIGLKSQQEAREILRVL